MSGVNDPKEAQWCKAVNMDKGDLFCAHSWQYPIERTLDLTIPLKLIIYEMFSLFHAFSLENISHSKGYYSSNTW